ncbi:MAG: UvrB/UvrC motif-containing protein, partial [Eubacterium sp.]|nr:UvrB/UvrC motif-containing protein [Eubacterium sp.]
QTIGRAARNVGGRVVMYADSETDSMKKALTETARRRKLQAEYNEKHGITPKSIHKAVRDLISISKKAASEDISTASKDPESMSYKELEKAVKDIMKRMNHAAMELNFELAAKLRDEMMEYKKHMREIREQ